MKLKILSLFAGIVLVCFALKSDKPSYQLFDKQGKQVAYSVMLDELKNADIVFFGELHDNPIAHWLQYEVTKDLYSEKKENLILGAEMFEADNQLIMDEYLNNLISEKKFEDEARLWQNYKTDYKPLVKFAKENELQFIATNIPRRYASVVLKKGFEGLKTLSDEAKKYIAPLPIKYNSELKCYKDMLKMGSMSKMPFSNENLPKAQAIKDATMAHFILKNWSKPKLLIHFNGTYHSDNFEGIVWYARQLAKRTLNKELKITTIATVMQEDIDELNDENKNIADYILCIPESMTRTY